MAKVRSEAALRKIVENLIVTWADYFGISQTYEIALGFCDLNEESDGDGFVSGMIVNDHPYRKATISFDPKRLAPMSSYDLERLVVHELGHIFQAEAMEYLREHAMPEVAVRTRELLEGQIDAFTRIVLRVAGKAPLVSVAYED